MPNWCMNNLSLEHEDAGKLDEFVAAFMAGDSCEFYLPTPRDENGELIFDDDSPDGWYRFRSANWGTTRDFPASDAGFIEKTGNQIVASFETAWTPPTGLYESLHDAGFKVNAIYFEPGMGFCGSWIDGEDFYVDEANEHTIPKRIWDDFNLKDWFSDE